MKRKKQPIVTSTPVQEGDIVVGLDSRGRIVEWNEEAEKALGYSAGEVRGLAWDVVFPKSGLNLNSVLRGEEFAGGFEVRAKDGRQVAVYFYSTPVRDKTGQTTGVACIGRDVTQFWRPADLTQEIERKFQLLAEISEDGVVVLSTRGEIVEINRQAAQLVGAKPEELIGREAKDFVLPEQRVEVEAFRNILMREGRHQGVFKIRSDSGAVKELMVRAAVLEGQREWRVVAVCRDISEELKAVTALRIAEEKFRSVFDAHPAGIFIETPDGTIVDMNKTGERMFNLKKEELIGKRLRDLVPGDVRTIFADLRRTLFERGEFQVELKTNRTPAGPNWVDVTGRVIQAAGQTFLMIIIRDITREKRLVEEIKESEARLKLLMTQLPAIIWTTDVNLRFTSALGSATTGRMGIAPGELIGMDVRSLFKRAEIEEAHRQALAGGLVSFEWTSAGRVYQARAEPLRGVEGQLLGTVGVAQDITETRRIAAELEEKSLAYQTVVENAPLVIAVHQDGKLVMINPAGARTLGYDRPEELLGVNVLDLVHPEDRALVVARARQVTGGETPSVPIVERVRHRDGGYVTARVFHAPFVWQGRPAVMVIAQDISREAELALEAAAVPHRRAVAEYSPHGIVVESEGRIIYANPVFAQMLGCEPDELVGRAIADLLEPQHEGLVRERMQEYQGEWRTRAGGLRLVMEVVTRYKVGEQVYTLIFVSRAGNTGLSPD